MNRNMSDAPTLLQPLSPEWATRILASLERIADALDRAIPPAPELSPEEALALAEQEDALARIDEDAREQWIAAIERLEQRGEPIPEGAYRKAGLPVPPRVRTIEPAPEELSAPQPGAALPTQPAPPTEPPRPAEPPQPPALEQIISTRKEHL
jgi:hypothetical protein